MSPLLSREIVHLARTCSRLAQVLLSEAGSEQLRSIAAATLQDQVSYVSYVLEPSPEPWPWLLKVREGGCPPEVAERAD